MRYCADAWDTTLRVRTRMPKNMLCRASTYGSAIRRSVSLTILFGSAILLANSLLLRAVERAQVLRFAF